MTDPVPSKDLLPCPFCGSAVAFCSDKHHTCHYIICSGCKVSVDLGHVADPDNECETLTQLQGRVAERWNVRPVQKPAHLREPPHCSTCACGLAPEPAREYPDPVTAFENLAKALPEGFEFPTMEADTSPLTHMEILSAVHHHASEIVRLTAAVPVECSPQPPRDGQ